VLGTLSEIQAEEVMNMADKHPAIREELNRIEDAFEQIAHIQQIPAPALSDAFIESLASKKPLTNNNHSERPSPTGGNASAILTSAVAILSAAVIGLGIYAYTTHQKSKSCATELTSLKSQQEVFASNYNEVQTDLISIKSALAIMNSRDYKRVSMDGTENAPSSSANIYWNKETADLYLSIGSLADLAEDQQYQLWAIIDGKPVDAGVFDINDSYLTKMKNIMGDAKTFAVTIETKGGAETPSLETMQVAGNL
jgi:anti-sigma-K factor RskA